MIQIAQLMQAPPDLWRVEFYGGSRDWGSVQVLTSPVAVLALADNGTVWPLAGCELLEAHELVESDSVTSGLTTSLIQGSREVVEACARDKLSNVVIYRFHDELSAWPVAAVRSGCGCASCWSYSFDSHKIDSRSAPRPGIDLAEQHPSGLRPMPRLADLTQ